MKERQLKLAIGTYSYGGNGGLPSSSPKVQEYLMRLVYNLGREKRIHATVHRDSCDTPITMLRNASVLWARSMGADLLLQIDSDMAPDIHLGEDGSAPFWESSFDFIWNHWDKGPCVVGAPYCGPPPLELPYMFNWANSSSDNPGDDGMKLSLMTREEAACRVGIEEAPALPTGLILWDMRCFELTEPCKSGIVDKLVKQWESRLPQGPLTKLDLRNLVEALVADKKRAERPWFYYDYEDEYEAAKCSTEDVTATRDVSLAGIVKLGYNPVFVNWMAWVGHIKQKIVGKPRIYSADVVAEKFARAVRSGINHDQGKIEANAPGWEDLDWDSTPELTEKKEECHVEQTEELGHAGSGVWGRDSAAETLPAMQECAAADG